MIIIAAIVLVFIVLGGIYIKHIDDAWLKIIKEKEREAELERRRLEMQKW